MGGALQRKAAETFGTPAGKHVVYAGLQRLTENIQNMGRFAQPLARAAAQGPEALGAMHFVLMQSEPAYRQQYAAQEKEQP